MQVTDDPDRLRSIGVVLDAFVQAGALRYGWFHNCFTMAMVMQLVAGAQPSLLGLMKNVDLTVSRRAQPPALRCDHVYALRSYSEAGFPHVALLLVGTEGDSTLYSLVTRPRGSRVRGMTRVHERDTGVNERWLASGQRQADVQTIAPFPLGRASS